MEKQLIHGPISGPNAECKAGGSHAVFRSFFFSFSFPFFIQVMEVGYVLSA